MIKKNIIKLEVNNKTKHLEKYLSPQWTWKTYFFIISMISVLTLLPALLIKFKPFVLN